MLQQPCAALSPHFPTPTTSLLAGRFVRRLWPSLSLLRFRTQPHVGVTLAGMRDDCGPGGAVGQPQEHP
jgi:hypothetical protein